MKYPTVVAFIIIFEGMIRSVAAEPYDLRGIALGITLSEFRITPFSDGKDTQSNISVYCTCDREALLADNLQVFPDTDECIVGIKKCSYFSQMEYVNDHLWQQQENISVATAKSVIIFYFVPSPESKAECNLFKIVCTTTVDNWEKYWKGYTGKYGNPTEV